MKLLLFILSELFMLIQNTYSQCTSCPSGFSGVAGLPFCYQYYAANSWSCDQAKANCVSVGGTNVNCGYLATTLNSSQAVTLRNWFVSNPHGTDYAYIGVIKDATTGQFSWHDGQQFSWTNWNGAGWANNLFTTTTTCARLNYNDAAGSWTPTDGALTRGHICEVTCGNNFCTLPDAVASAWSISSSTMAPCGNTIPAGHQVNVACLSDYKITTTATGQAGQSGGTMNCNAHDTWNEVIKCNPVCSKPPSPLGAFIDQGAITYTNEVAGTNYVEAPSALATVSCAIGYDWSVGTEVFKNYTCTAAGVWTPSETNMDCVKIGGGNGLIPCTMLIIVTVLLGVCTVY